MAHMRCCVEARPSAFSSSTKAALKRLLMGMEDEMGMHGENSVFSPASSPLASPRPSPFMVRPCKAVQCQITH